MAPEPGELDTYLAASMEPGFRGRLLARGQAKSMIRRNGVLPDGAPAFEALLDYDLLNYGYSMLSTGLRAIENGEEGQVIRSAFFQASVAIESASRNAGDDREDLAFHRLISGAASHLGGFAARAYSLIRSSVETRQFNGAERALANLIWRNIEAIERDTLRVKALPEVRESAYIEAFSSPEDEGAASQDPASLLIIESYLASLSSALFALAHGEADDFETAVETLELGQAACSDLSIVGPWWIHRLTVRLLSDLAATSLREHIPEEINEASPDADWANLRENFIATLFARERAEIDLWPSQLKAVGSVFSGDKDLVVSLPTSSGKTRIAELCILSALGRGTRIIYITPLRALSAQTERILELTFRPMGVTVSSLYGKMGTNDLDEDALRSSEIVVATPEKLDFALRSDPTLLNDVGLIVLDEGHMIGTGEREVRYEAQIQRLLRREDSHARRIVCLSAVLPSGEDLNDFVNWITQDAGDGLITSLWRPTEQRFGDLVYRNGKAQLQVTVGDDRPFIPRFIEARPPPRGSRRRNPFPSSQRELVLATAMKLVEEQQTVLIFCPQRNSVEPYAEEVVKLHRQGLFPSLLPERADLSTAIAIGTEWFGEGHPVLKALELGVVVHHGALPGAFRKEVERLLRENSLKITVASPTLAQGLNLSASSVLFHGLRRGKADISGSEFSNVIGRAGRAYIDTEGLVLYPIYEMDDEKRGRKITSWRNLSTSGSAREIRSGLIGISVALIRRIIKHTGVGELDHFIEYLTSTPGWDFPAIRGEATRSATDAENEWERNLGLLDSAILSIVGDEDADGSEVGDILADVLKDSLWERQLGGPDDANTKFYREIVRIRSEFLWENSTTQQRRGWYLSGVGMRAGIELDEAAPRILELTLEIELLADDDIEAASGLVIELAEEIFGMSPFEPEFQPENWKEIIKQWVLGEPLAEFAGGKMTVAQFVESDVVYRLIWGMEAARVYQLAKGDERALELSGVALAALETGTFNRSASALIRAGFDFRSAAIAAAESTNATFTSSREVRQWVRELGARFLEDPSWPTEQSRPVWMKFASQTKVYDHGTWAHEQIIMDPVVWVDDVPEPGTWLRVVDQGDGSALLYSGGFQLLGRCEVNLNPSRRGVDRARVVNDGVEIHYRGPQDLLRVA